MQTLNQNIKIEEIPHKKRGFNMIEIGIYLVIATALLIVLIPMGKNQVDKIRAWLFSRQLTEVQISIEALSNANNNFASATNVTDAVRMEGGISSAYYKRTGLVYTYESPWGGEFLVTMTNSNWTVSVDEIPNAACIYWLTNPPLKDLTNVNVNEGDVPLEVDGSVGAVTASNACASLTNESEMVWTVG